MPIRSLFLAAAVYAGSLVILFNLPFGHQHHTAPTVQPPVVNPIGPVVTTPPVIGPYEITTQVPDNFLDYDRVIEQLKKWNEEAPDITSVGVYGKNRQSTDIYYMRIGTPGKPRLLITAAIHGNERLSTACTLGIMGRMLHDFKRSEEVTWLVENREIYFVPVFSPESYLKSRHIEEGDPNRRWAYPGSNTNNGSSPIQAMQKWFLEMKFVGAIDGHTYGRDFFWPSIAKGRDRDAYQKLAGEMAQKADYSPSPVSNSPAGYAIDWYYWKGAVAILTEFGNGAGGGHSMPASMIPTETERTYSAYLHFMRQAPEIKLEGVAQAAAAIPNNPVFLRRRPR